MEDNESRAAENPDETSTERVCFGCKENTKSISELWVEIETLEKQNQSDQCCYSNRKFNHICDSCEELKSRVKQLEVERESLLLVVKLLSEDNQTVCASVAAKSKPSNDDSSTDERNLCDEHNFDFINNDNINDNCLNTGGLHLNPKGIYTFASNLRNYIKY